MYDVAPAPLESFPRPRIRSGGGSGSRMSFGVIPEEEGEEDDGYSSPRASMSAYLRNNSSSALSMRSSSNVLRVPGDGGHGSLYRTNSQEMVDQVLDYCTSCKSNADFLNLF